MAQDYVAPELWQLPQETIELIPLTVTLGGSATTSYTISVIPDNGTRPSVFAGPSTVGDEVGYLVNGPTLLASAGGYKNFRGFVKVTGDGETPELEPFHIKFT
jgi:hypothetical protein